MGGWNNIYMVFVGDRNNGQVDLGAWMIEDMHSKRLDFAVFYSHQHTGSEGSDNTCRGISDNRLRASCLTSRVDCFSE